MITRKLLLDRSPIAYNIGVEKDIKLQIFVWRYTFVFGLSTRKMKYLDTLYISQIQFGLFWFNLQHSTNGNSTQYAICETPSECFPTIHKFVLPEVLKYLKTPVVTNVVDDKLNQIILNNIILVRE